MTDPIKLAIEALDKLTKLGNGESYGNSIGNTIAFEALAALRSIKPDCRTCKHSMDCWPKQW
jgi:hypothetical protein